MHLLTSAVVRGVNIIGVLPLYISRHSFKCGAIISMSCVQISFGRTNLRPVTALFIEPNPIRYFSTPLKILFLRGLLLYHLFQLELLSKGPYHRTAPHLEPHQLEH